MFKAKFWVIKDDKGIFKLYRNGLISDRVVLSFTYNDVIGLKYLESKMWYKDCRRLIDSYIREKLGFLPDYSLNFC